jgi:hypothetical protein
MAVAGSESSAQQVNLREARPAMAPDLPPLGERRGERLRKKKFSA